MANWYDNIPAPVDANGREVPLDTKELVWGGETREVLNIAYSVDYGRWLACLADGLGLTRLSACTLPDSWERLEEDIWKVVENDVCGYFDKSGKSCDGCPACGSQGVCSVNVLRDALRRAKALADRDAKGSTLQASPYGAKEANRG